MTHPVDAVDSERDLEVICCLRLDLNDRLGGVATVPAVIDNLVGDLRGRQRRGSQQKPRCQLRTRKAPKRLWAGRGREGNPAADQRVVRSLPTLTPEATAFAMVLPNGVFCSAAFFTLSATMVLKLSATMRLTRTPMPALKAALSMTSPTLDGVSAVNLTNSWLLTVTLVNLAVGPPNALADALRHNTGLGMQLNVRA